MSNFNMSFKESVFVDTSPKSHNLLANRDEDDAHPIQAITGLVDVIDEIRNDIDDKQPALVVGENIKTINGNSILGEGDIEIVTYTTDDTTTTVNENGEISVVNPVTQEEKDSWNSKVRVYKNEDGALVITTK